MAVSLCLASVAGAQDEDVARAKTYFVAGAQAYSVGKYEAAIQAFDEAYRQAPRSAILFSTAQALRRQYFVDRERGRLDRAIELFRRYVREVPQGGRRADAVQALSELEPLAARLDAQAGGMGQSSDAAPATRLMISSPTPAARISVDGAAPVPAPYIAEIDAGKHRVKVTASGFEDDEREVLTVKGELLAFDVRLRERPAHLRLVVEDGARIYVDGRYQGEAPLSKALQLPAGKHVVSVIRAGYDGYSSEVVLERGKTKTLAVELSYSKQRNASLVLLGAGGVSMVVSLGFLVQSLGRQSAAQDVLDRKDEGNITAEDLDVYDAARRDRDQLRIASAVAAVTGLGFAVVGGTLYLVDTPRVPEQGSPKPSTKPGRRSSGPKTLSAAPVLLPGFLGGGLRGTF